jgi:hypothetical protein
MELTLVALTVKSVAVLIPPNAALIVVDPKESPVTNPLAVMEAMFAAEDCHCETAVTS